MPAAARLTDPIGHSPTMSWLLKGLLIGAAIAVAGVAIVGTGGLAAVAVVGAGAAMGAGLGEAMSTMSFAGKEVTGAIAMAGSANVFVNSLAAARAHVDMVACSKHPGPIPIATGSGQVFINGMPAARVDDKTGCSAVITKGSSNVYIGGGTVQTDDIHPEDLVPGWVHASLLVVGVGSAIILAGPVIAIGGLIGAYAGGYGGAWAGGKIFGEGSDGQKWSAIAGSFLGGYLGAKAAPGAWEFAQRIQVNVKPGTLGMNGGNVEISLAPKATPKGTTGKPVEVASGDAAAGKPPAREYKVVTKHRPGNRQVVTDGQRWHLPKGVEPESIPARDPIGNRLQELTTEAAGRWNPRRNLSPRESRRIKEARDEGAYWRANLLEKQAKGRWVEKQVKQAAQDEGLNLDWNRVGVDVIDPETGLRYDILSGTKSNIDDHAKRMPDEIFRMIIF